MKWNFTINQRAIIENSFSIDLVDAAIFDLIKDFAHSGKCKKSIEGAKIYYWVSWKFIVEQAPILGLKTRQSVYNRIEKLAANGLLERHPDNKAQSQSWFCFGANYDKMAGFSEQITVNENAHPVNENLQPCKEPVTAPVNENLHYTTIKNNSINNTNNTESENFEEKPKETVLAFVEADRQRAREAMAEMAQVGTKNSEWADELKSNRVALETICRNTKIPMDIVIAGIGVFSDMETAKGVLHPNRNGFRSYYINWIMSPKWLELVKTNMQTKNISKPKYKNESIPQHVKDRIVSQHNNRD